MRAAVLRDGRMMYRDDLPDPIPGPGQVLVAVRSCGICGSDLHFAAHGADVLRLTSQMDGGMDIDLGRDISTPGTPRSPNRWRSDCTR